MAPIYLAIGHKENPASASQRGADVGRYAARP